VRAQVLPMVVELTQRVADRMSQHTVVDITDGAKRITSDIMGHMLLGEDLGGTRWE
jgi:cytochrome P450